MSAMPTNRARNLVEGITPYQVFMLALCVWALLTLSASAFLPLDPSTKSMCGDTSVRSRPGRSEYRHRRRRPVVDDDDRRLWRQISDHRNAKLTMIQKQLEEMNTKLGRV